MKTKCSIVLFPSIFAILIAFTALSQAATFTAAFTNQFGDGIWERDAHIGLATNPSDPSVPGNWSTQAYPNNGHSIFDPNTGTNVPGDNPSYDAVINGINCQLSVQVSVNTISLTSATLNLSPGATLAVAGATFSNSGTILVNTTGGTPGASIRCDGSPTITGSGNIRLNGNANFGPGSGSTVTIGASQLIHGHGTMDFFNGGGHLINDGTINADDGSAALINMSLSYDAPGQIQNQNHSVIEATAGSVLLFGGIIDQTGGGSFSASGAGSIVEFGNGDQNRFSVITGGTFTTSNNGLVRTTPNGEGVTLIGGTNNGAFQVPAANNPLIIKGTGLTNNGNVTVGDGTQSATMRFDESGLLGGTGGVQLNGAGTFNVADLTLPGGVTVTNGASHLIHGNGTIIGFDGGTLINNGTIIGDVSVGGSPQFMQLDLNANTPNQNNGVLKAVGGGGIGLFGGTIDQTGGGSFLADGAGSLVLLNGTVVGGTLTTQNSGIVRANGSGLTISGSLTNSGTFEIPATTSTFVLATTLTNNGTMTLDASDSLLRFDQNNTAIAGAGSIVLTNGAIMRVSGGQAVTNGSNHTLKGNGSIDIQGGASLTNNGIIAPGASPGQLNYSGQLNLGSTSNLFFEIGGTTQGTQYDWLNKIDGGVQTLGGELHVRLINAFTPASSDIFTVVTTQNILAGSFSNVANGNRLTTDDGGGSFQVTYSVVNDALASRNVTLSDFQPNTTTSYEVNGSGSIRSGVSFNIVDVEPNKESPQETKPLPYYEGTFSYSDKKHGFSFTTTQLTTCVVSPTRASFGGNFIQGTGKLRRTYTFTVVVTPNKGSASATLNITTSNGYSTSGSVSSGKITITPGT